MVINMDTQLTTNNTSTYRIAIVHPSAGVNWSGGTENFAIELAHYLSPYFQVELLGGSPQIPHYYPAGGIPRNKARDLIAHPWIGSFLRRFSTNPDIVIEHLTSFFPSALRLIRQPADLIFPCNSYGGLAMAGLVRNLLGTPILYKAHNGLLQGGKLLTRDLQFKPDHLVVFSKTMERFVNQAFPQQPVSIIPNGVDVKKFTPLGEKIDLGLPKPIVLCVASLNRQGHKRVELAIQAVSQLSQGSLLVCGDGQDRQYYQAMGERLLGSERFSVQTFPFEQMPMVYRSADIFTLPSIDEPFGQAYVQAMASGLTVVATDDELRQWMVADAGILCDVTNIHGYASAIRQGLQENCQSKALENAKRFSWERVSQQYRDLMLKMIQQSKKESAKKWGRKW